MPDRTRRGRTSEPHKPNELEKKRDALMDERARGAALLKKRDALMAERRKRDEEERNRNRGSEPVPARGGTPAQRIKKGIIKRFPR
jgi:hypothetical protein